MVDIISRDMERKEKKVFAPKRRTWKLQDEEAQKDFGIRVAESWEKGAKDGEVWGKYKDCVLNTADEVCGWTRGKSRHDETW